MKKPSPFVLTIAYLFVIRLAIIAALKLGSNKLWESIDPMILIRMGSCDDNVFEFLLLFIAGILAFLLSRKVLKYGLFLYALMPLFVFLLLAFSSGLYCFISQAPASYPTLSKSLLSPFGVDTLKHTHSINLIVLVIDHVVVWWVCRFSK